MNGNQSRREGELQVFERRISAGPLPPPEILQKYDQVLPGAAERIIVMAEKQAEHRRAIEGEVIRSDVSNSRRGQFFGFIIALAVIFGGIVIILQGYPIQGFAGILITLGTLVGVFVYGNAERFKERRDRREAAHGEKNKGA